MKFWSLAWEYKWCTLEQLKMVVKTEDNKFGEITIEEYKQITGIEFTQ
ncbi:XkdX family protein [Hathewaya massiliensis]|nr:XkdX family protein [Hathewaya massiliensis]